MDAFVLFLGIGVSVTIASIVVILSQTPKGHQASTKAIEGTNFFPTQLFMGCDGLGGLAVNEQTGQLCLFPTSSSAPQLYPLTDLIGTYLIKNGEIIGEGQRSYPKEIVTYGRELFRKKDNLIRSLQFSSSSNQNQRIDLLIAVHDLQDPLLMVNFLNMETKEGGILFEKALSTATHWHYVLDGLILEADQQAKGHTETSQEKELAVHSG